MNNQHTGSNFDDFLEEEGILEEVSAKAHKRLLSLQLGDIMEENNMTKTGLAEKLSIISIFDGYTFNLFDVSYGS